MKNFLFGIVALSIMIVSCQKEAFETPGKIQGMGNTPGKLEIKAPFVLPQDIKIVGEICGLDNSGKKGVDKKADTGVKTYYTPNFGSGGKMVKLLITLVNTGSTSRTIFFPKGLLWECKVPGYQHAILLQTTWICLLANTQRTITIDLYCINNGMNPSDQNSTYQILGVTSSNIIGNLLNLIGWRKINYEMIFGTFGGTKGIEDEPSYEEITERLQTIVWNLTNFGEDLSVDDKTFIQSIPELPSTEVPVTDPRSQYPDYFEEFIVKE